MPSPEAQVITLSKPQQNILAQIVRRTTHPYRLVRRARLILLAAQGVSNTAMSQPLDLHRAQVRLWRDRWYSAAESLRLAEQASESALTQKIMDILNDDERPGTHSKFSVEQIVQIVAVACEPPEKSHRPVTHWTPTELAAEVIKRGIVTTISPRGDFTTAS
jgi:putative transposase